jgi:chemotaxis protein MotA
MGNLSDTSKLGAGIAVAFVATVYGVGSANLIFLPMGTRIKKWVHEQIRYKEMILEGALSIQAALPPHLIEMKLKFYLESEEIKK